MALSGNPSHSYWASPAICDFTPATRQVNASRLNPSQTGSYSIYVYAGGMEDWVDLSGWLYTETWQRPDQESNPRPVDRESDVLAVTYAIKWLSDPYTFVNVRMMRWLDVNV